MPHKTKRNTQVQALAEAKRQRNKNTQRKNQQGNEAQSWRLLEQEAAELPWCRPFTGTLEANTDLEDDTSDF
ncbi:hypothetical protein GQ600_20903 [Phytophthora cactorum]|nr:hypothetical protein GQ600_20903 [Phytophthora cactorum]